MKKPLIQLSLSLIICLLGLIVGYYLIHTKPKIKKRKLPPHIPSVKVFLASPTDYEIEIQEFGTVRPIRTGEIVPEVSGKVFYVSPHLIKGGRFKKGEVLIRLDPRDYEAAVALAEGELREAERLLAEVESEAESSLKEWKEILGRKAPPPPLVVKRPQLAAAKARLKAAQAKLRKARLDLERTVIRAPFEGLVVEENVDVGQFVTPGMVLARIYDAQAVEVAVSLDLREIKWIEIPAFNSSRSSEALVFLEEANSYWQGKVVRAAAKADEKTRLLEVFVRVKDPFSTRPPLLPGFFVKAKIKGRRLKGVYVLPREAIKREGKGFKLYLVDDQNRLVIREAKVIYETPEKVIVQGLRPGTKVVLSPLAAPVPGMKLRPVLISPETS